MEWPSPQFVSRLWKQTSGVPRPMGRSNKHHRRPWYTWSKHHGCHPSEHTGQAMLITTGANKHHSMRSRCPNRVLRRKMCCSPPCSSITVPDRQTHRARDARLIATGLGEDCWPRELPDEFANNLIQAPAKLTRRSSDMLVLLADLQLLRDEGERGLGHFSPPVVDDQGMPSVGHLADFRDGGIFLLLLVGGIGDRHRGGVVFLARDDQEWSTLGVLRIDLGFRPRVEVGGGCLEEWHARSGHRKRLVQLVGFVFVHLVGEGETELLVGQWDGSIVVQRVAQHR